MIALLYDIHGNLEALEAVLRDCPAERFVLGGDYAVGGPLPLETVERLRDLPAEWIRGNADRWLSDDSDAPAPVHEGLAICRERLGPNLVEELYDLPLTLQVDGALCCHASPGSDMAGFAPVASEDDEELLRGPQAELVVFGHTHVQFERTGPGGVRLVNPGSVGMPFDGDHRAAYALLYDDGRVDLRRVEYDWRPVVARVREDIGEPFASRIEQARFDPA